MNRTSAGIGIILLIIAMLLFYVSFTSPGAGALANGNVSFLAFLLVIILLPIGAGLLFFGAAYRRPILATGVQPVVYKGSPGTARAALAVAVIALIVAIAAFAVFYSNMGTTNSNIAGLSNSLASEFSAFSASGVRGGSGVNQTPSVISYRVDWSNTDPTGQDRFNPYEIIVPQGDTVVIMFEHNDTDAHTFTMYTATTPYGFQINDTVAGMHDFLNDATFAGGCVNQTTNTGLTSNGVSTTLCVSGSSLLPPGTPFRAINPNPGLPFNASKGNPSPILIKADNLVHEVAFANTGNVSTTVSEIWGIGAFVATTPGVYFFFCDYHVSNGMFGYLVVLPNAYCSSNPGSCSSATSSTTT